MISKHIMLTDSHGQLTPPSQQIQNCNLTGVPHYGGPYKIHRHFCLGLVVILFAIDVEATCREPQVSQRTHLNQVAPSKRYGLSLGNYQVNVLCSMFQFVFQCSGAKRQSSPIHTVCVNMIRLLIRCGLRCEGGMMAVLLQCVDRHVFVTTDVVPLHRESPPPTEQRHVHRESV